MINKIVVLLISILFVACTGSNQIDYEKVFRYNEAAGISSLDPAFARNMENMWAVNQLYEGLVQLDENLAVKPCLATSWEIDSTGTTYTFYIKPGIFFHADTCFGGSLKTVTAHDVLFSFSRIMDNATASPGRWIFDKLNIEIGTNGMIVLDDLTFQMHLKEAYSPFLSLLTMPYAAVVSSDAVTFYGNNFARNPVGTGPYQLFLWKEQVKLVMHQHAAYHEGWDNSAAPRAIMVSFIKDKGAAFLELLKGNFDMISGIDGGWKDEMLNAKGALLPSYQERFYLQKVPYLKTDYLGFQLDTTVLENSPWNNKLVRQAINAAIDKQKIITYLRAGVGIPATEGFIPPTLIGRSLNPKHYNIDSAKTWLTRAGFQNGKGLPELEISTTADYLDICELIQNQLKAIGIQSQVNVLPSSNHRELVANGQLRFFRKSWIADFPNAENFMCLFQSSNKAPNGPNYTRFEHKKMDALLQAAAVSVNYSEQQQYYAIADSLMMDEMPMIPLFYDEVVRVVNKRIRFLPVNGMNMLMLKETRFME
ncbi:MAG: ABC-type transport system substrate-binding protein [Flavobacteriales bacterium]|jgi:ABC-type transport system substrate-binding protein